MTICRNDRRRMPGHTTLASTRLSISLVFCTPMTCLAMLDGRGGDRCYGLRTLPWRFLFSHLWLR